MSDIQFLPAHFALEAHEAAELDRALAAVTTQYASVEAEGFIADLPILMRTIPERLVRFLAEFRRRETHGGCVISGIALDQQQIGLTPDHWRAQPDPRPTGREEMLLVLLASVLGDVFAWRALQDGRLVQDLLPIRSHERQKSGNSSASLLDLHVEDAFHPHRADYLGLMCLRNPDAVPTTYSDIAAVGLSVEHRSVLAQRRFRILPDETHIAGGDGAHEANAMLNVPVLFGAQNAPYLCVDGYFMEIDVGDDQAAEALTALLAELERAQCDVALDAGEILFIDNYRAVHGRKPFRARYDGTDRWLKRVNVTRDLRKSRSFRECADSRIVN